MSSGSQERVRMLHSASVRRTLRELRYATALARSFIMKTQTSHNLAWLSVGVAGILLSVILIVAHVSNMNTDSPDRTPQADRGKMPKVLAPRADSVSSAAVKVQNKRAVNAPAPLRMKSAPQAQVPVDENKQLIETWLTRREMTDDYVETARLHRAVLGEQLDPHWAPTAQSTIDDSLINQAASQPDANLTIVNTACGATVCEIMAIQPQDNATPDDPGSLTRVLGRMMNEPWYAGFSDIHYQAETTLDGRTMMVVYFERRLP